MTNRDLKVELKSLVKNSITPLLKSYGFKKNGDTYIKNMKNIVWVIDIQKSRWNDENELQFTFNCGIYFSALAFIYSNTPNSSIPRIAGCCIHSRIEMLSKSKLDKWWSLQQEISPGQNTVIIQEVEACIQSLVIPFLEKFNSINDILDFLKNERPVCYRSVYPQSKELCMIYIAIIYSLLGQQNKSFALLNEFIEDFPKSQLTSLIPAIKNRICAMRTIGGKLCVDF